MEKRPCISVGQMFTMLFVSRMVITITYGNLLIGKSDIWDHLISAAISFFVVFLLIIPIYKLFSMDKFMNIFDNMRDLMGKAGYIFILIYVAYFMVVTLHTLTIFDDFISNAVNPPISLPLLSIFLLLSSCYGAYKGIEALARTCTFIMIATVLSLLFLGISLISSIETINFKPLMYEGFKSVEEGALYMISQSSCLVSMGVLFPLAKGNKLKGFLLWNLGVYLTFAVIITLAVGTMGDFIETQLFPIYTAASIGKFGSFRHLDSLYLGIWISGIFMKTSLFMLLSAEGIKKIWGEKVRRIFIISVGILFSAATFFMGSLGELKKSSITMFLLLLLILCTVLIPLILIILKKRKLSKEEKILET